MSKVIIHMRDSGDGPYVARVEGCNKSHAALIGQQAQEHATYDVLKNGDMIATTTAVFAGHYPPVEVRGRLVR